MMKRLDVAAFLLVEAQKEQELLNQYQTAINVACEKAEQAEKDGAKYVSYYGYLKWDGPIPRKSTITHNLRMIRRLCLQGIKEMKEI